MLNCNSTFELYNSNELATNPYSPVDYGETRKIVGIHGSLESIDSGRLTYIQANSMIKEAYIDNDGTIKKDTILLINVNNRTMQDAFVFDDVAAVKVTGYFFVFFKKPLTLSSYSTFLKPTADSVPGDG